MLIAMPLKKTRSTPCYLCVFSFFDYGTELKTELETNRTPKVLFPLAFKIFRKNFNHIAFGGLSGLLTNMTIPVLYMDKISHF